MCQFDFFHAARKCGFTATSQECLCPSGFSHSNISGSAVRARVNTALRINAEKPQDQILRRGAHNPATR